MNRREFLKTGTIFGLGLLMMKNQRLQAHYDSALVGANLERADLRGMDLRGINLTNANLRGASLDECDLRGATLIKADLSRACLLRARLDEANMTACDLSMSYGRGANFTRARMWLVYLRHAQYKNAFFIESDLRGADFVGTLFLGSRFDGANVQGVKNAHLGFYNWWYSPISPSKLSYEPIPGWIRLDQSVLGDVTVQENASRQVLEEVVKKGWVKERDG